MSGTAEPSAGRPEGSGGPSYLDLPLRTFLGLLRDDQPAPAGGAAAAVGVALAASLCLMTARLSSRQLPGAPAEPGALQDDERRRRLAAALSDAADVPMRVAEIGVQVAALATRLATNGNPNVHGDAVTAALLAEAGARSACTLVRINLSGAESDQRLARVAHLLAAMPSARGRTH